MAPKPFFPWTAPAGARPSAVPVMSGSIPTTTQCTKPSADRSVTTSAMLFVPAGTPDHESAGETPVPGVPLAHVKRGSMFPSSSHGARRVSPSCPTPSPGTPDPSAAELGGTLDVVLLTRVAVPVGLGGAS